MANTQQLLLAYYGDDFTGSTDALEFLSRAGIKTMLFIEPPTAEQLARYEGLQAIGIAGMTRAMAPDAMEKVLRPAFEILKSLQVAHVHYKVCSTFDSSPQIGSIGKAADVGAEVFGASFIPLLVAAPALGRYCLFGNLFARMGIGSQGEIYRLDRHPSMSNHPTTPADESDLRLHLGKQTGQKIGLLDVLAVEQGSELAGQKLHSLIEENNKIILFDALNEQHLLPIGQLIDSYTVGGKPLFSIGSSGIEMALGQHWAAQGITQKEQQWAAPGKAENMLVVSGSCSPVTARQIEYALSHGFADIAVDTVAIAASADAEALIQSYIVTATELIGKGTPVIVHTSVGTDDKRVADSYAVMAGQGLTPNEITLKTANLYGTVLGRIALGVAGRTELKRLVIAGGDTSGYVARAMGIEAVEMIAPLSPGAPLCLAYAPETAADGLEVNIKGGQVGAPEYFNQLLDGRLTPDLSRGEGDK
jgi:uncharacterized protein YgbK (DUF1537 family)